MLPATRPPAVIFPDPEADYIDLMPSRVTRRDVDAWLGVILGEVRTLSKGIAGDRKQVDRAGMYARLRELENRIEEYRSELGQR